MVVTLFVSVVLLGLAAIDPLGIAAMPVLLVQQRPFARSFAFLSGSFVSLMVMGVVLAQGFGVRVLRFERLHAWLVPAVQLVAGVVLMGIAAVVFWQLKRGKLSTEASSKFKKRLSLNELHLFALGAAIVAVQSILDVVFVIAMIRIGQLHLSSVILWAAVATYGVAALILQAAVIVAYGLTSAKRKQQTLNKVRSMLAAYGNQAVVSVTLVLGCGLLVNGILALAHAPHI